MFDLQELRQAFGRFPTGVTIVTTCAEDGSHYGFTANSFTSVSLDPPLILICPGKHLSSFDHFSKADFFAVNILAEGQEEISTHFATFKGDRFQDIQWHEDKNACPLIEGAAVQLSCKLHALHDGGDHIILIGEVVDFAQQDVRGLGFLLGRYFNLGLERKAHSFGGKINYAGLLLEYEGQLYLPDIKAIPKYQYDIDQDPRLHITQQLAKQGYDIKIGAVYSLYHSDNRDYHYLFYLAYLNTPPSSFQDFVKIEDITQCPISNHAEKTMLARFAREYQHRNFGLYIGEESQGEIR